ncbi:COP9 signalosome complex subunit 8 [Glossina fuscipes]|uniref:COP9 signalosome complex subunit 8 n=1 Tax=Glossina fuscipes TaxID=7396 RepID=A0A9C6E2P0_9MUSC|nr:COP9 signalosome complex subunit 8 [Glossina fuscipes]
MDNMQCVVMQSMERFSDIIEGLENEELETRPTDASAKLYINLCAYYLVVNKMTEANLLWKRVPQHIKEENDEMQKLYLLTQCLHSNNLSNFFRHIQYEWSDDIKSVMDQLHRDTKKNALTLIGNAYTSIFEHNLSAIMNMPKDQLKEACTALEWDYECINQKAIVFPKRLPRTKNIYTSSEYQLSKLTEFVSFLEN